jgi:hypothetical protein
MNIIKDDAAQTSAELLLLFGGIMVIVIVAAIVYRNYLQGLGNAITGTDLQNVTQSINNLTNKFS